MSAHETVNKFMNCNQTRRRIGEIETGGWGGEASREMRGRGGGVHLPSVAGREASEGEVGFVDVASVEVGRWERREWATRRPAPWLAYARRNPFFFVCLRSTPRQHSGPVTVARERGGRTFSGVSGRPLSTRRFLSSRSWRCFSRASFISRWRA